MEKATPAGIGPGSTILEIASHVGGEVIGPGDLVIRGLNGLDDAGPSDLTFLHQSAWAARWASSGAGAALVSRGVEPSGHDPSSRALILVDDAEIAMLLVLESWAAQERVDVQPGIDASAVIDPTATIGAGVHIGPHVSIGPGARVDDGACIDAGVRVGANAGVGSGTVLHANVVIEASCEVGAGCRLHAGVMIGADGFGYRPDPAGAGIRKVPHLGTVMIGDDVEIGASTCIDRGKFGATVIGDNTKIDNLVQIAHNVRLGRSVLIAAQAGLAGSVTIGDGVQIGAQVGIVEHVKVGAGARIGAKAGVIRDVPPGEAVVGVPAQPVRETLRQISALRKLPKYLAEQGQQRKS